jgi:hypothetical protein
MRRATSLNQNHLGEIDMHRRELQTNVNRTCKAALTVALLAGTSALNALAGGVTPPTTPTAITPPSGNTAFLLGNATGTQGYICLPDPTSSTGVSWGGMPPAPPNPIPSRPQATLFTTLFGNFTQQILTHFLSPVPSGASNNPTWQSSFDSSTIWGSKVGAIEAGSDPSCPNSGAIPCLLLSVVASQNGPSYPFGILTNTTYVQRLNTKNGSPPANPTCTVGAQLLVGYSADYYFYSASH